MRCRETMQYKAALEYSGNGLWYGRMVDLIGTHARAKSRKEIQSRLRDELFHHIEWLKTHGEKSFTVHEFELSIVEEISDVPELGASGGEVAFFTFDHNVVTHDLLTRCIRFMGYHREDLFAVVNGLSDDSLNQVPRNKNRSILDILSHICSAEEFYISRMGEIADSTYEKHLGMTVDEADSLPILERMVVVRQGVIASLRELVPQKNGEVLTREEYTRYPGEKWSAYKILRRFLEHEREHIYNIRGYLGLPLRYNYPS